MTSVVRILLGVVLLGAGSLKFLQPVATVLSVGAYDLLPAQLALAGGLLLPGVEVTLGAALLVGVFEAGAAALASLFSASFLFFVGCAWARGLDVSCGCFGPLGVADRAGPATFALDLVLLAGSLLVLRRSIRSQRPRGA